jgi:hypothetical protein
MLKRTLILTLAALITSAAALAQEPKPTPAPGEPKPAEPRTAPKPEAPGRLENIKLDLTITDQTGPGAPLRKTVTMIVADRERGAIRSRGHARIDAAPMPPSMQPVTINVDAVPQIVRDGGAVRVQIGLEYQPHPASTAGAKERQVEAAAAQGIPAESVTNLNEQITLILVPGKPMTISQAADPVSDRRITVELTATILK